ncbi:hypothetical protein ACIBF5_06865 [Micromonospora sp. NPDC050417]|uniref:hypothetical protein n=1 Tax=Micromonospora sp. NPDC050417 TaxID=3364280 RepID=UPI0037B0F26B
MATYLGGEQIEEAQALLARHVVSCADGRCLTCDVPGPCPAHERATSAFFRSLRLPRRTPAASRPELCGARWHGVPGSWWSA